MARKKAQVVQRKPWLLVAGCSAIFLAAAALVYWQTSANVTLPNFAGPLQRTLAAAPAPVEAVRPPAASNNAPAVARVKNAPAPVAKTTAAKARASRTPASETTVRADRREAPVTITADSRDRRDNVVPPSAPKAGKSGVDSYEAMARASLQERNYTQAREHMESALAHGGKATFVIAHDHSRGNFESDDANDTCVGELTILANELRFLGRDDSERFAASWADVKDVGSNRFFGSGRGGFHVSVNIAGKYKNFNLAPESKEKAEAKLILDLLNSYTRKGDRSK